MSEDGEQKQLRWYQWFYPPLWGALLIKLVQYTADRVSDGVADFVDKLDGKLIVGVLIGYVYAELTQFPKWQTVIVFVLTIIMAVFWNSE